MNASISISRYKLLSQAALNARSTRLEREGALIRVRLADDQPFGYACIHPWPELGDPELEQILAKLSRGEELALSRRALVCARADAAARAKGVSLFEGLTVPRSHATLLMREADLASAVENGFTTVKVKVGRDRAREAGFIREQAGLFPGLKWRLDFNGVADHEQVSLLLKELGEEVRDQIDFLEDAYPLCTSPWVDALGPYGIPMAVDREIEDACGGFGVAVIKPALNDGLLLLDRCVQEEKRAVFTSYMDHPLGQCFAAWEAAMAWQQQPDVVATCGLVTHALFEPNAFSERLGPVAPGFTPPSGTGLGFDDLLEKLPWKKIL